MSGEFGNYHYTGYIDSVLRRIAEECMYGENEGEDIYVSTHLVGVWLDRCIAPLLRDVAYDEAYDAVPTAQALNQRIAAIRAGLDKLAHLVNTADVNERKTFDSGAPDEYWDAATRDPANGRTG